MEHHVMTSARGRPCRFLNVGTDQQPGCQKSPSTHCTRPSTTARHLEHNLPFQHNTQPAPREKASSPKQTCYRNRTKNTTNCWPVQPISPISPRVRFHQHCMPNPLVGGVQQNPKVESRSDAQPPNEHLVESQRRCIS